MFSYCSYIKAMELYQMNRRIYLRIVRRTEKYLSKIRNTISLLKITKLQFEDLYNKSNDIYHKNRILSYELVIRWLEDTIEIINSLSTILPRSHLLELDSDGSQLNLYNTTIKTCHNINSRMDILYNNQKWINFIDNIMST